MKSKVLIISFLILSLLGAFTLKANAQDSTKILIADETWITQLKTGAKIVSYSEQAFKDISLKFGEDFKRISIEYKQDRHGKYKQYIIYLSKETASVVEQWAEKNL